MDTSELIPDDQMKSLSPPMEETSLPELLLPLEEAEPVVQTQALEWPDELEAPPQLDALDELESFRALADVEAPSPEQQRVEITRLIESHTERSTDLESLVTRRSESNPVERAPVESLRLAFAETPREPESAPSRPLELEPTVSLPLTPPTPIEAPAEVKSALTVHAPIELHIHVESGADAASEQLREELRSVVPAAVHNAIEQLALQLGVV